jgi:hypothetical protein
MSSILQYLRSLVHHYFFAFSPLLDRLVFMATENGDYHTTSIRIPPELWKRLCMEAVQHNVSAGRLAVIKLAREYGVEVPPLKPPGRKTNLSKERATT